MAEAFCQQLASFGTLQNYDIATCPGNHDIAFSPDPSDKDCASRHCSPRCAMRGYEDFYNRLFYRAPNAHLSCGRHFLLGRTVPVDIVCLNSSRSWNSTRTHFKEMVFWETTNWRTRPHTWVGRTHPMVHTRYA